MGWKPLVFAMVVLSMSATGYSADLDNTKHPATNGISSPSDAASFFEGVWVGKWGWAASGNEITITVEKKNRKGLFGTTYSWESGSLRTGHPIKSGSFKKTWGKEQGDQFVIEWKNKEGVKTSITLKKESEDTVKAVYDSDGAIRWIRDRADCVGYLKRK